jgi:hypothetical protein
VYIPQYLGKSIHRYEDSLSRFAVEFKRAEIPPEAMKYDLGIKPFIAANAEAECRESSEILVFLDPNVIVIKPPDELLLPRGKIFGYRPVMHQNIGSRYNDKPDSFWSRIYSLTEINRESIFPLETVADKIKLRPYFNAGLLAVRPERGIFRRWVETFHILYTDSTIVSICKNEAHRIFLHQAALAGAVMKVVRQDEYLLLPDTYNYPLFFEKFYESKTRFNTVEEMVVLKCEIIRDRFRKEWWKDIAGPPAIIDWLSTKLK